MILEKESARELAKKIMSLSKADSVIVRLTGSDSENIRFALNSVSTTGSADSLVATVTSNFGSRSGSARISSFDSESLERGVRKSEEIAGLSRDNPEFMPPLEKQNSYPDVTEFFEETSKLTPRDNARMAEYIVNKAEEMDLTSAGYIERNSSFSCISNSNDLFAFHKATSARFSSTARTRNGKGSSKVDKIYADVKLLDTRKLSDKVLGRAALSGEPSAFAPGKYVTILDTAAVADMLNNLGGYLGRREADEGRSYFSEKNHANKIGQMLFNEKVNLYSDPQDKAAPSAPFENSGYPLRKTEWIKNGVLKNLYTNRYWAKKSKIDYIPYPPNIILSGGEKSIEDLIKSTDKGIFVTRFWYIRQVDPQQVLLTGLTRDGVFLIENGKVVRPINNFRFNESPINILKNVIDMSVAEKSVGSETYNDKIVCPALKLSEFNFSSVSDAT